MDSRAFIDQRHRDYQGAASPLWNTRPGLLHTEVRRPWLDRQRSVSRRCRVRADAREDRVFVLCRPIRFRPSILGLSDDVGSWVGSTEDEFLELSPRPETRIDHLVATDVCKGDILIYARLFAWAMPSEYVVVVGRASDDHFDDQAHGRTFSQADA